MPKLGYYSNIKRTVFSFPDMKINFRMYLSIIIQTYCATSTVLTNSEILRELIPKYRQGKRLPGKLGLNGRTILK